MFETTKAHDISILHLYGEISLIEIELIQNMLSSFRKSHHNKVLLDLAQVDYLHFQAVRKWAQEAVAFRRRDGDLGLISANRQAKLVLQFTGADQHLKDYASIGEAILSFLKSSHLLTS